MWDKAEDPRPKELQFNWVRVNDNKVWHVQAIDDKNRLHCNSQSGVIGAQTAGLINNPSAWGHRMCEECMREVWRRVYDYSLSKPKE